MQAQKNLCRGRNRACCPQMQGGQIPLTTQTGTQPAGPICRTATSPGQHRQGQSLLSPGVRQSSPLYTGNRPERTRSAHTLPLYSCIQAVRKQVSLIKPHISVICHSSHRTSRQQQRSGLHCPLVCSLHHFSALWPVIIQVVLETHAVASPTS